MQRVVDGQGPLITSECLGHKESLDFSHGVLMTRHDVGVLDLKGESHMVASLDLVVSSFNVVVLVLLKGHPV